MNISNVSVTKTAQLETGNGKYQVEYVISNGNLIRVHATISDDEKYIGCITYDHNTVTCNLPYDVPKSDYFTDFDKIIVEVKKDCDQYLNESSVKEISAK